MIHAPSTWEEFESLGRAHRAAGRLAAAESAWRQAIQVDAEAAAGAWAGLALLCQEDGRLEAAEQAYRAALALRPAAGPLWHNLGALFKSMGRRDAAFAAYREALACQGDYPEGFYNLGNLHEQGGEMAEAEAAYRRAIELKPDYAEGYYNLGIALRAQDRLDEAEAAYRRAIMLREGYAEARNNLGLLMQARAGSAAAEAVFRQAVAEAPRYAEAHNNLGVVLQERQAYAEAEREFQTALTIRPDFPDAAWNLALMRLIGGRYAEAWPLFGARTRITACQTFAPPLPFPEWQGESLAGKSLLVWPEQGFGDEILCCRFFAELRRLGVARLVVACKPPLRPLFANLPGVDACIDASVGVMTVPACDYWVFSMSLPARFAVTLETLPARLPYLSAPPGHAPDLEARVRELPEGMRRVGLVWRGSQVHANDRHRSLPSLSRLAPLWRVPGVSFVSLQLGEGSDVAEAGLSGLSLGDALEDFGDTASAIAHLDLVISVDTAVAHLAAAMGKPTWIMLPWLGQDWRWLQSGSESPWYPGVVRLFRQAEAGGWDGVLSEVAEALSAWSQTGPA